MNESELIKSTDTVIRVVLRNIFWLYVISICAVYLVGMYLDAHKINWDSTDGNNRSQMEILIDCGQRLQYLTTRGGGLTPRLDAEGSHMTWQGDC